MLLLPDTCLLFPSESRSLQVEIFSYALKLPANMGAPRRKNIITSRRRVDDDGEEEGSIAEGIEDDSLSEGSAISDADDDADAEGSDGSDIEASRRKSTKSKLDSDSRPEVANGILDRSVGSKKKPPLTAATADTEVMMNGLRISGDVDEGEEMHYDDMGQQQEILETQEVRSQDLSAAPQSETLVDRRRREHDEYKKKRDADPAFVPNRGGFFMHDHRSAPGQNGFRPLIRGRGRGRGNAVGPFQPST